MTYERDEQFFTKDDTSKKNQEAKQEMLELVDPDLLGLRKKDWNKSVKATRHSATDEEDFQRKLTKVLEFFWLTVRLKWDSMTSQCQNIKKKTSSLEQT